MIRIEDWAVIESPFTGETHLSGKVYGHPTYRDGVSVVSSSIVGGNAKEKVIITMSGSHYTLGQVNENYEKIFPNAEERVWKAIQMMEVANNAQNN